MASATGKWQTRRLRAAAIPEVEEDGRVEFLRAAAALVEWWAFLD
jgi:hypothetical protein